MVLQHILCIRYSIQFSGQKDQVHTVKALLNSGSKVNAMTLVYAAKLGLTTQKTIVGAQKINGLVLETYSIVSVRFWLQDSLEKVRFFEETFLLTNISLEVVLGMSFLTLNNEDVKFVELRKPI